MPWDCDAKRNARNYADADDRKAFNAGYSDGYHGYEMWSGNERNWHPNAYSAGYWEGVADKAVTNARKHCEHDWRSTDNWLIDRCAKCGEERA